MADVSHITVNGTTYDIKDPSASPKGTLIKSYSSEYGVTPVSVIDAIKTADIASYLPANDTTMNPHKFHIDFYLVVKPISTYAFIYGTGSYTNTEWIGTRYDSNGWLYQNLFAAYQSTNFVSVDITTKSAYYIDFSDKFVYTYTAEVLTPNSTTFSNYAYFGRTRTSLTRNSSTTCLFGIKFDPQLASTYGVQWEAKLYYLY